MRELMIPPEHRRKVKALSMMSTANDARMDEAKEALKAAMAEKLAAHEMLWAKIESIFPVTIEANCTLKGVSDDSENLRVCMKEEGDSENEDGSGDGFHAAMREFMRLVKNGPAEL